MASDTGAATRATMAMLASRVVIAALGWVGSVIIARTLSPEGWGHYSFVFALLGLMAIFTDLGVGRAVLARLISDDKDDVALTASAFIALRVVLGLVGYIVSVAYVVILQYPGEVIRATAVAGLVVVVATPGHALTVLFQSRHRLVLTAVAESLGQAIQLAVTIAAVLMAPYLLIFVLAPVLNELIALTMKAVGIARASSGLRPARRIEFDRWRSMLRDAAPLAIGFALTVALLKIDVLMLSLLDTFDAVGMYSIGYKFSDIIDTFALAAAGPVSTLLVAAWPDQHDVFRRRTRSAALLFALAGALAVAAFWPSAEQIIELLYGERFVPAAAASRLLVVGAALMSLIVLGIYLLAAAGKQRHYPLVAVGGLVLNVVANVILIPRMSYDGAAIATVVTLAAVAVVLWVVVARVMPIRALLPLGPMTVLVIATVVVCVVGTQIVGVVPWPVVSAAAVLAILGPAVVFRKAAGAPPPRHSRRRPMR
ncbi:oligosaccharide flippase family protein [Williamsia maris]|uniref:Membrane protein involved in the export of O-antigen and teichoic acid n=1 Tax=Williamsia maris TaxID=72806 RepID=A0ABT1HHV4_9NOCA|nr:oligosaccharide flippase family protein [Williamsia maris]MCP2177587.1 Membrane protein involved in the export of O-antigen and teichoic acid [Williamsia maris]